MSFKIGKFPECFDSKIVELIEDMNDIIIRKNYLTTYYEEKNKLPKPNGKKCIICSQRLPKRRRSYCSDECFRDWYNKKVAIKSWNYVRTKFIRRNKKCIKCGERGDVVDHIIPIALGGEEFNPNNLQTLCVCCNKIKTRFDARNIAFARKIIKLKSKKQKQLNKLVVKK